MFNVRIISSNQITVKPYPEIVAAKFKYAL